MRAAVLCVRLHPDELAGSGTDHQHTYPYFFFFCPESLAKAERAGEAATAAAAQGGEWAWEAGNHHQGVCGTWSVRDVRDGKRLIGEKEGGGREGLESGLYGNGRKGHRQS